MTSPAAREEALFTLALGKPVVERGAFLDRECADDPALRQRLDALLAAHEQPDTLLAPPGPTSLFSRPTIRLDLPDEPADDTVGMTLGRYKLLERLGEGGCGVVYVAEQTEPVRRRVALKVIKLGMDTKAVVARFEAERQALAMMDHPNIAKVLDAGTTGNGRPYFVMELVRGIRITEYCDQAQLSTRERLDLFIKVCQAIQHAHQKGIIHRDIKPSNILVTLHDGDPVPKVIDFGIAKATEGRLTDATVYTQLHQFIGTPAYMSPEQAEMSGLDIDTRSDIYSLGVLLYEMLIGRTPFDARELVASGIDAMRRTIREQEPVRPSTRLAALQGEELTTAAKRRSAEPPRLIHLLQGDLDWIVMKCMEKDRSRRYDTANGLAADLKRHLGNEPVMARPPSTAYRIQKAFRRNQLAFAAGIGVAFALILGLVISTWQAIRATRAEQSARLAEQAERLHAEEARTDRDRAAHAEASARTQTAATRDALAAARRNAYVAEINVAFQALAENNLGRARDLLDQQRPKAGEEDLRGFEWRHLWQLCAGEETLTFHGGGWEGMAYSPDGRFLACGSGLIAVRETASRKIVVTLPVPANSLSFSQDSRRLAGSNDSLVTLWDTESWKPVRTLPGALHPSLFSPDGRWLLTGAEGGFRVWDTRTWQPLGDCPGAPQYRWFSRPAVAFSPDSQFLVTIAGERYAAGDHLRVWRLPSLERLPDLASVSAEPSAVAFSGDGQFLFAGLWDGRLMVWDFASGRVLATRKEHTGWISALKRSANGQMLATASADRTITLWDATTFEPRRRLRGHVGEIWALDISPNGLEAASSSTDRTTRLWSTEGRTTELAVESFSRVAGFTAGGRTLVAVTTNTVCLWTPESGARQEFPLNSDLPQSFSGQFGKPYDVSRDQPLMVRGGLNGVVEVWALTAGAKLGEWHAHVGAISTLALTTTSSLLATASTNGEVKIWDFAARRELARIDTAGPIPTCLAFSPDGNVLAVSGRSTRVFLWRWRTGQESDLPDNGSDVFSVAFSPDGKLLASSTQAANEVRLWDVASAKRLAALKGHVQGLSALAFSPDGRTLATASGDRRIKLWNLATCQEVASFAMGGPLPTLSFSPDGRLLAIGELSDTGRGIHVLLAPSFEEVAAGDVRGTHAAPNPP